MVRRDFISDISACLEVVQNRSWITTCVYLTEPTVYMKIENEPRYELFLFRYLELVPAYVPSALVWNLPSDISYQELVVRLPLISRKILFPSLLSAK